MAKKKGIKKFIDSCSLVFKTYKFDVEASKGRSTLWHFTAKKNDKKYVVYCAPQYEKTKGLVKIALKKVPHDSKLVVVCANSSETEKMEASGKDYSLIDIETLERYGTDMIDALAREQAA